MNLLRKIKKGFTLVELVVVIAVIAILSAVSVGAYVAVTDSARQSAAEQEATTLRTMIQVQAINEWSNDDVVIVYDAANEDLTFTSKIGTEAPEEGTMAEALEEMIEESLGTTDQNVYTFKYGNNDGESVGNGALIVEFDFDGATIDEMTLRHSNGKNVTVLKANN